MSCSASNAEFRKIVAEYSGYVYSLSYRILLNSDDARDAVQETFVKVLRSWSRMDPTRSPKNWICTIAINAARDVYRSRRHQREAEELHDECGDTGVSQPAVESRIMAREILGSLDVKYRTVMVLFYVEQRSVKEIASIVRRPAPLVKVWLCRARKTLLEKFGGEL